MPLGAAEFSGGDLFAQPEKLDHVIGIAETARSGDFREFHIAVDQKLPRLIEPQIYQIFHRRESDRFAELGGVAGYTHTGNTGKFFQRKLVFNVFFRE